MHKGRGTWRSRLWVCDLTVCVVCLYALLQADGQRDSQHSASSEDAATGETTTPHPFFGRNESCFWCPRKCICSKRERIIDCSSLGLMGVPVLPPCTKRLYLHNNQLTSLQRRHFQTLDQLTYLILGGNQIKDLNLEVFDDLYSLKYLILDGNNISHLSPDAFQALSNLETISLARNQLEVISDEVFSQNRKLTLINLQGNNINLIHQVAFKGLHQLTTLNLEGNHLDEHIFDVLQGHKKLATLRVNGNRIRRLPPHGLDLTSLKHLALHSNNISKLPPVLMKNCSSLEILTLNQNSVEQLERSFFTGCSSLAKLHFQRNNLKLVLPGTFTDTKSLTEVYLCNNHLKDITPGVFQHLRSLVSIHLEKNEISYIAMDSFVDLPVLEAIYLHQNAISHIHPGAFVGLPVLKYLVLYKNNLRIIRPSVLTSLLSLQKIQIDPLKCSCSLLPLVTWLRSRHLKGIRCIGDNGKLFAITSLRELCQNLKDIGINFWQTVTSRARSQEEFPELPKKEDVVFRHVMAPKGPSAHFKQRKLDDRMEQLEKLVVELQYKVLRFEALLADQAFSCRRSVCLYDGVRLLAGDEWIDKGTFCSCLHDGTMKCS